MSSVSVSVSDVMWIEVRVFFVFPSLPALGRIDGVRCYYVVIFSV